MSKQKSNMVLLVLKTFGVEPNNSRHGPSSICIHHLHIPRQRYLTDTVLEYHLPPFHV